MISLNALNSRLLNDKPDYNEFYNGSGHCDFLSYRNISSFHNCSKNSSIGDGIKYRPLTTKMTLWKLSNSRILYPLISIFLLLISISRVSSFEKSFNSIGLGHEDTFEPNFQTSFLGELDNVYLKEIDKEYDANFETMEERSFSNGNENGYTEDYTYDRDFENSYEPAPGENFGPSYTFNKAGGTRDRGPPPDLGTAGTFGVDVTSYGDVSVGSIGSPRNNGGKLPVNGLENSEYPV